MAVLKIFKYVHKVNCSFSHLALTKNYSQSAVEVVHKNVNYPPIVDVTPEGLIRNKRNEFYDYVRTLPTVEEKQNAIALAHNHRLIKVFSMSSAAFTYTGVPFKQYITRTHLIRGLPQRYQETNVNETFNLLQPHLYRLIDKHMPNRSRIEEGFDQRAANGLISMIYRLLSRNHDFHLNSALAIRPRLCAYWWHGGFPSMKDKLHEKNICFQYNGHPDFAVRTKTPLAPIVSLDDPLCASADVPNFNYHPAWCGIPFRTRWYITSTPGFWPGDSYEYPFVSFHLKQNITKLKEKVDHAEALMFPTIEDGCGIMSSFGWLLGIAMNLGFTPFHDVTYPLVTQTVVTDGQDWHFFVYQLNTVCFHDDVDFKNKRNICWSSGKMRLFESYENGELKGVNDDAFKILLQFLNSPQVLAGIEPKPYLSDCTKSPEEFKEIKEQLQKMSSNRPDPKAHRYEVPLWQHIYKWHRDAPPSPQVKLK